MLTINCAVFTSSHFKLLLAFGSLLQVNYYGDHDKVRDQVIQDLTVLIDNLNLQPKARFRNLLIALLTF